MEVVQERLERESGVEIIQTAPNVTYEVLKTDGEVMRIERPAELPDPSVIDRSSASRSCARASSRRRSHIGAIMTLATSAAARSSPGVPRPDARDPGLRHPAVGDGVRLLRPHEVGDTRGYGTLDYEVRGFFAGRSRALRILVGGTEVDALSVICHKDVAAPARPRDHPRAAEDDPAPALRGGAAGGHRRQDHRPRDDSRHAQERDRQVLRRRRNQEEKAPGEAEGRQEAHAAGRQRRHPAGGLPGVLGRKEEKKK